ncbi:hypothetical protein D9M71_802220 [compost metagenome]
MDFTSDKVPAIKKHQDNREGAPEKHALMNTPVSTVEKHREGCDRDARPYHE